MIKIIKKKWSELRCKHAYHASIKQISEFKLLIQNECRLCNKIKKQITIGEHCAIIGDDLQNPTMIAFPTKYIFSKNN